MIQASPAFLSAAAALAFQPIFALEIDGYSRVFTTLSTGISGHYPWISLINDHTLTINDLDGSSSFGDLTIEILDYQHLLTGDMATTVFEGKVCRLKAGFAGMNYIDFVTMFTGRVSIVPMASAGTGSGDPNAWLFTCQDTRIDLTGLIYPTGDDGQPTSSSHPKTVIGNPLDILISILYALGYTDSDLDLPTITGYRDQVFAGMTFEFSVTTSPQAKDFIEAQIMKPLGGYVRSAADGRLTVHFFTPLPGRAPVMTLDPTNLALIPGPLQADLVNVVTFRFDDDGSGTFLTESVQIDAASVARYNQQGQLIIESSGMKSGFQGNSIAAQTAGAIFSRYGFKNPKIDPATTRWNMACLLEPGDLVLLTHPLVPDRDLGTFGMLARVFEVLNRTWQFSVCNVQLTLVDGAGAILGGICKIAPDAEGAWTAVSAADKAKYMFITNAAGVYSDSTPGNKLS